MSRLHAQKVAQELLLEELSATWCRKAGQVVDVLLGEVEVLYQLAELIDAAGNRVTSVEGVLTEGHVEAGFLVDLALLPIALGHGELVQVGKQS